jgi:hypothetical protein
MSPPIQKLEHRYQVQVLWTGNTGQSTTGAAYEWSYKITVEDKPAILGWAGKDTHPAK